MNKKITILTTILIIISMMSMLVLAENQSSQITEYQEQNTYVFAQIKDVKTTINGDLFLITSETNIDGTINKDLNAITSKINIKGVIGDDLRLIAADAKINAYIFGEMKIISDTLHIKNMTHANGVVMIKGTKVKLEGTYAKPVALNAKNTQINAIFQDDLIVEGNKITINPNTRVHGTLNVSKNTKVPEGVALGDINYIEINKTQKTTREIITEKLALFLMIAILASIMHAIARKPTQKLTDRTYIKPLKSMLIGLITLIILPIVAIFMLVTIILAPVGLLIMILLLALLILVPAITAIIFGEQIIFLMKKEHEIRLGILLGTLLLIILSLVPGFLGFIIFISYSLVLGTIMIWVYDERPKTKSRRRKTRRLKQEILKQNEKTTKTTKRKKTTKKIKK
ncbi:MAG: hypothetical protein ACLFN8_01085 [Candidatus Woesearchaeota archaeon]